MLQAMLRKLKISDTSLDALRGSYCLGIFMALSPFWGIQTWLAILWSRLLRLHTPVVVATLYVVNNPFTMVPIIVANYACGYLVFEWWLKLDLRPYDPHVVTVVMSKISLYIRSYFTVHHICFWCYILGGLLFAVLGTGIFYACSKIFSKKKK